MDGAALIHTAAPDTTCPKLIHHTQVGGQESTNYAFSSFAILFIASFAELTMLQEPSYELEIFFQGEWMEVLGCGVTQRQILEEAGHMGKTAWAFG